MAFPLTLHGEVVLTSETGLGLRDAEALARLAAALEAERPSRLECEGREVRFRVNFFRFVSNWNLLVPVDRGVFVVTESPRGLRVSYELSFRRLCALVTCMVGLLFGPVVLLAGGPVQPWQSGLLFLLGMWSWLFGANYLQSAVRFPRFIRRTLTADGGR